MRLEEILSAGLDEMGITADSAALPRFRSYYEYLTEINAVMNLTAISGEEDVSRLHFLDCAALLGMTSFAGKRVIDVGTGAGFPGLPLKIVQPDMELCLLDSLEKRVNFLRECCKKLDFTDVNCVHLRAEEAPQEYRAAYDIAVSRAVARLSALCELCLPFVKKGGLFIAMKGPDASSEMEEAGRAVSILGGRIERKVDYAIPGTELSHCAVIIRKEKDTPSKYPRRWAQIKKSPL